MLYADRVEGGKKLAAGFAGVPLRDPLVLAIPRGGVVTASELAQALDAELDIVVARKLGAPGEPELAIGAIMHDGTAFMNEDIVRSLRVPPAYIDEEKKRQLEEAIRRLHSYRGERPFPVLKGRTVIIVDDGVATGATMLTALAWAKAKGASEVIAAAPVAPGETVEKLRQASDRVVCPATPDPFFAIGQFYREFSQVDDSQVMAVLRRHWGGGHKQGGR